MAYILDETLDAILDETSDEIEDELGRTTRNTNAWNLGQRHGESFRMAV